MRTKWETNLTKLIIEHHRLNENETLLVKLVTLTRITSPKDVKYESNTKVCSATFELCNGFIRWCIHDMENDSLIIQTPIKKGAGLGYTDFENIDEIDSIYVVTAYRVVRKEQLKRRYDVYAHCKNGTKRIIQTISTESLTEAKAVATALKANGITTEITKAN